MTSLFANKALLPAGWADNVRFRIHEGRLESVAAAAKPQAEDARAGLVIPGLCNAHSHAFQRALAGHTEQRSPAGHDSFWTWRERMYELAGSVDAAALTAIARQVYCEMLTSGYTSVVEFHYLHRDPREPGKQDAMLQAIITAAEDSGIRLTYVPVLYERAGFDSPEPGVEQRNFAMPLDEFLAHYARAVERVDQRVGIAIGAHSLRAVRRESLLEIVRVARDAPVPLHLHIAEQQREVDQCMFAYGRRPVRWLLENFDVSENWCLVHATHMDFDETAELAKSGAVVALCPSTEANLGDGLFPLHDFLKDGGRIAIGSDSHVSINPFEELRWLEYGQRLATRSRNIVSLRDSHVGRELFSRVLDGGALAGGQGAVGLAAGAPADLVVLSDDDPMLAGHDDESRLDALVFSGYPLPIERVMVNGDWRVIDASHVERQRARDAFAATMASLGEAQ
ncbi:MAG: formimidoylglutamate deiminase [Woeseiaceae bacterium]